ncbi:MFS multidrug transporter protein [Rutstroemia sp. NJR-2017a WRK4]|nr:MFS multidrug transporter protein [Rutstroemia sp. NJR-2017a WRK4]
MATTIGTEFLKTKIYALVIIQVKARDLCLELDRPDVWSFYDLHGEPSRESVPRSGCLQPLRVVLYLLLATITPVFQEIYGFSSYGPVYIGGGLDFPCPHSCIQVSDAIVMRITAANSRIFESEIRLPAMHILPCSHANSLLAGSSAYYRVHCMVPITGTALFDFASMGVFIPIQTYLTDTFMVYAASATATHTAERSLYSAFFHLRLFYILSNFYIYLFTYFIYYI